MVWYLIDLRNLWCNWGKRQRVGHTLTKHNTPLNSRSTVASTTTSVRGPRTERICSCIIFQYGRRPHSAREVMKHQVQRRHEICRSMILRELWPVKISHIIGRSPAQSNMFSNITGSAHSIYEMDRSGPNQLRNLRPGRTHDHVHIGLARPRARTHENP